MSKKVASKKVASKKVYKKLYYSPDCVNSREFIAILGMVPGIAKDIKCINIGGITEIPSLNVSTNKPNYEANVAFQWLLEECEKMLTKGIVDKQTYTKVRNRVNKLLKENDPDPIPVKNNPKVKDEGINRFTPGTDATLSPADYIGENIMDRVERLEQRRQQMLMDGTYIKDRMKNTEQARATMLEQAQRIWEKQGKIDPETGAPIQKQMKQRTRATGLTISPNDIQRFEEERGSMIDTISHKGPTTRSPIARKPVNYSQAY